MGGYQNPYSTAVPEAPTDMLTAVLNGIRMGKTQAFTRGLANTQRQYEVAKERYDAIVRQLNDDKTNQALQQAAGDAREDLEKAYKAYQNYGQKDAKAAGTKGDKAHQGQASKLWDHFKNVLVGPEHVPGNEFSQLPGAMSVNHPAAGGAAAATSPGYVPGSPPGAASATPGVPPPPPGAGQVPMTSANMSQAGARMVPGPSPAGIPGAGNEPYAPPGGVRQATAPSSIPITSAEQAYSRMFGHGGAQ